MNKEEEHRVTEAFKLMDFADLGLEKAVEQLAKFGTNVPSLNVEALKLMAERTNTMSKSIDFIRSFIRVSMLQQIVPKETDGS